MSVTIPLLSSIPSTTTMTESEYNASWNTVLSEFNPYATAANTLAAEVEADAVASGAASASALASKASALSSAASASLNASAAAASAGAALWVSGTTYTVGYLVWSPANGRNYRRKTAGAGTTDPSADAANWTPVTLDVSTGMPTIRPSLLLNFADSKQVDPRITATRASSATYFDSNGVMQLAAINAPRIDFDPATGECLGLLLEESKTNLLTYSGQLDNAAWTPASNGATRTADNTASPDGTTTADLIDDVSAAASQYVRQVAVVANDATTYSFSIFVKKSTSRYVALWLSFSGGTGRERVWTFDLDGLTSQAEATYPATTGTIEDIGGDWRRLTITASNTTEGNTSLSCRLYPAITALGAVDVTATGSVWAWGAQLEPGRFASSYIPTTSTTVTRSADVVTMTGINFSNWYRQAEGAFVVRASVPGFALSGSSTNIISITDGTANNAIYARNLGSSTGTDMRVVAGGVDQVDTANQAITGANERFIVAAGYKINDFAVSTDGSSANTDTSGTIPTVTQMGLCTAGSAWIEGFAYYPTRLTDAELVTLSTL